MVMKKESGGIDEHTLLMLHFDGNMNDSSIYGRSPLSGNRVSYVSGKFGNAFYVNTLASYIRFDKSWFIELFRTGIYTIDFWSRYITGEGNWASFMGIDDGTVNGFVCNCQYGHVFQYGTYNNLMISDSLSGLNITNGSWHHYAIVSDGSNVHLYVNGNKVTSAAIKSVSFLSTDLTIGGRTSNNNVPNGNYLDEFRISNIVRWTGNFTPPTKPYE